MEKLTSQIFYFPTVSMGGIFNIPKRTKLFVQLERLLMGQHLEDVITVSAQAWLSYHSFVMLQQRKLLSAGKLSEVAPQLTQSA